MKFAMKLTANERAVAKTDEGIAAQRLELTRLTVQRDELAFSSREARARRQPAIDAKIVAAKHEMAALIARRKDQSEIVQREAIAAQRDVVAAAEARRIKQHGEYTAALAQLQQASDKLNTEARIEDNEKLELATLERDLAIAQTPLTPGEIAREAAHARLVALARPEKLESDGAPSYGDPLKHPEPVTALVPEVETTRERAERLAGFSSEALVEPASVARINALIPSAAQSQVVMA